MKKNKILMIYPNYYQYDKWYWMPTNFVFLASTLLAEGYECILIDDRLDRSKSIDLINMHLDDTFLVLISSATGRQLHNARFFANLIKLNKDVAICMGGSHPTALPEITMQDKNIDFIIQNQGEYAVVELAKYINSKDANVLMSIPNLYYRDGVMVKKTVAPPIKMRIKHLPPLPYFSGNFIDPNRYINPETMAINYTTTTGCVGSCSFCFYHEDYNYSSMDVERVLCDIDSFVEKYNIRNINFEDPTFFISPLRVRKICNHVIDRGYKLRWRGNGRIDTLRKFTIEDMRLAKQAGCDVIHIGLESGSERILKLMKKNIDLRDIEYLLKLKNESDIQFRFHIILGVPTETIEDLECTADLLKRMISIDPAFDYTINFFTPYPGNGLTALACQNGYLMPTKIEEYENLEMLNFKYLPASDREIISETSPWEEDFDIPWFDNKYNNLYFKKFRELIPEKLEFVSTGGRLVSAIKKRGSQ